MTKKFITAIGLTIGFLILGISLRCCRHKKSLANT